MCSNCRGRFDLPIVAGGCCEVCVTLQRLNRVILTRHPAAESTTLLKLLSRTAQKIEAFVEEWEANKALGTPTGGGISLGGPSGGTPETGEPAIPGLRPAAKSSSAPSRSRRGSPTREEVQSERASKRDSPPQKERSVRRSRSKKEKKDKKKRRSRRRSEEGEAERRAERKARKAEAEAVKRERSNTPECKETKVEEASEVSETREDRRSPQKRHDDAEGEPAREEPRLPRSPSRSPPGFTREGADSWDDREPIERNKPKKDKGYSHYLRGKEFRDKYGYDRGRGRGQGPYGYRR